MVIDFRPGCHFSAFETEVLLIVLFPTSVPKASFRRLGRKFHPLYYSRLPSLRPLFSVWYGSFTPCALADFRIRGPFSAFGTEVSLSAPLPTSVSEACFRRLGRKSRFLHSCRLPYSGPISGISDGSFAHRALADFRIRGPFSAFCTEVALRNYFILRLHRPVFLFLGQYQKIVLFLLK
jgi:hypothetical protein